MQRLQSLSVLLGVALLCSCDQFGGDHALRDITAPLPSARIKFHNFSPSSVGVNFYANNVKMTAVLTSACNAPKTASDSLQCKTTGIESATGVTYGGVASGGRYDAIAPGQYTLTSIKAADATGAAISTVSQAITAGKYYSYFMSGPYNSTTKTAEAFVVEDPVPAGPTDYAVAYVRFVNAVSNGTGPLNLVATNTSTSVSAAIGGAVAYKSAGAFIAVPSGTYNLMASYTGAGASLISRNTLAFVGGHIYTITARGSTATTSTLGLDYTENQP